jgi:hypothetical protein
MTEGVVKFVVRQDARKRLRRATALGLHNFGGAVQVASMAITPVHGDASQGGQFATFAPGVKPIGGTLRRSHYTVTFLDGVQVAGPKIANLPEGLPRTGIVTVVGTSAGYGFWVHEGTSKMPGRPHLSTALLQTRGEAPALMAAGTRRALRS